METNVFKQLHKRPHLFSESKRSQTLKTIFQAIRVTAAVVVLTIVCIGLYIGATWDPFVFFSDLRVVIINRDGDIYGDFVQQHLLNDKTFAYSVRNDITNEEQFIRNYQAWFAVTIPQNFTLNINNSLRNSAPYQNNNIVVSYDDSRNFVGSRYGGSLLNLTLAQANTRLKGMFLTSGTIAFGSVDPRLIVNPISIQANVFNRVTIYGSYVAATVLFFFAITLAQASISNNIRIYNVLLGKTNPHELLILRIIHGYVNIILLTLFGAIIIFGMGVPTNTNFVVFWLYFILCFMAFSSIISFLNATLGPYTNLVFPAFTIINFAGSGAVVPFELQPRLFRYGVALPLYHALSGAKYIILGTGNEIGLNIGVLFIYWAVFLALTIALYYWNIFLATTKLRKENLAKRREKEPLHAGTFTPYGGHRDGPLIPEKHNALYEDNQCVQGMREQQAQSDETEKTEKTEQP